jgi:aminopeptidase N
MLLRILFIILSLMTTNVFAQMPPVEPGVSQNLAKWRSANYSDVRYKLNLTLEKMSPVLKGTMEIRVNVSAPPASAGGSGAAIVLDWRKIRGKEDLSKISNVSINGKSATLAPPADAGGTDLRYEERDEHLIFTKGVVKGENVIKLDFTSPIAASGAAITRYVDKEDGAEYVYSLFVPSDASTAFPIFDQPDLKARFQLNVIMPIEWKIVSNSNYTIFGSVAIPAETKQQLLQYKPNVKLADENTTVIFAETKPISTYVFAFAAGEFAEVSVSPALAGGASAADEKLKNNSSSKNSDVTESKVEPPANAGGTDLPSNGDLPIKIYVRKSQVEKFKQHSEEVFRLNREGVKYLESYFDYKFPFPKYDLVLIPEFPFGGMEHAGATFLREDRVIFPTEPTKNDFITRANLIFHEAAHQWFGDTVTMRWFDDLWLKEGFAEFMAYKTLEKVLPEYNAWKVFYERNKQAAYLTDVTRGTTPIYQEIPNLASAKSAYGNIVYRKAPSFLKQAEFYLGEKEFQTAVRAFLKKHEFANAEWTDLVKEFETASKKDLDEWADNWVTKRGMSTISKQTLEGQEAQHGCCFYSFYQRNLLGDEIKWRQKLKILRIVVNSKTQKEDERAIYGLEVVGPKTSIVSFDKGLSAPFFGETSKDFASGSNSVFFGLPPNDSYFVYFPNYQDYGYGIFLLDEKSRAYVLSNIQNEKDDFLRSMMWGSLWDSVRFYELAPEEYVRLVIKNINAETDESTIQTLLNRVSTAMNYYIENGGTKSVPPASAGGLNANNRNAKQKPSADADGTDLFAKESVPPALAGGSTRQTQASNKTQTTANVKLEPPANAGGTDKGALVAELENLLLDRMQNAATLGQKITFYRAFLNIASSENARAVLKDILTGKSKIKDVQLKTKDKFDIVTKLLILSDKYAPQLLAELEKTETSDDAKRYAYAAKAGIASAENKARVWNDFVNNKEISESWIESAFAPFNSVRHSELTLPYLEKALAELPNLKRNRKIFFVNGWLAAFIGGQKSEEALAVVNKFLADNPNLDRDLRLKILENVDGLERAVRIRSKFGD